MERIRKWFGKTDKAVSKDPEVKTTESTTSGENFAKVQTSPLERINYEIDPKVADYFKDFPEPYKTKAIVRFSSREGLFQWDFFRDRAMLREFETAKRGEFLEDRREYTKRILEEEREARKTPPEQTTNQDLEDAEDSALVKAVKRVIPVHHDETVGLKLFQTGNFVMLGFTLLWAGVTLKKRKPNLPSYKCYSTIIGTSYFCLLCQIAAVYRLNDWGYFDRSVDNRDALTKFTEEAKENITTMYKTSLKGRNES